MTWVIMKNQQQCYHLHKKDYLDYRKTPHSEKNTELRGKMRWITVNHPQLVNQERRTKANIRAGITTTQLIMKTARHEKAKRWK